MTIQTQVNVNGIDVTTYLKSYEYEKVYGDAISEISIVLNRKVNDILILNSGQSVEVWRGYITPTDTKVFSGYIEKYDPEGGIVTISANDKLWKAVRGEANLVYDKDVVGSPAYPNGKISKIFQDLINSHSNILTSYGVNTNVVANKLKDTGADFVSNGVQVGDYVWNVTDNLFSIVTNVDSQTQLSLADDIFLAITKTYEVIPQTGIIADNVSVQDSSLDPANPSLDKFVCNHADPFERCKALATCLGWQFYYRADTNKVYFEPQGFLSNPNTLTVGDNVIKVPKWTYDTTEMCNDLTVVGAQQMIETTEGQVTSDPPMNGKIGNAPGVNNYNQGYRTDYVQLGYVPYSVKVWWSPTAPPPVTSLKIGGVPDSTTVFDYYVDQNQKRIYPKDGTTFPNNNYFMVNYSLLIPVPVHMSSPGSITKYGEFKKTLTYTDIRTVADAQARGTDYLSKYAEYFIYTTMAVNIATNLGLDTGQLIQVVDNVSQPNVNKLLLINRKRFRYPSDYDEIDVGDKIWRLAEWQGSIEEKLKRMQEKEYENTDFVTELVDVDNSITSPINLKNRYFKVQTQTVLGNDIFIFGNPTYGILGTSRLGDADMGVLTNGIIQQYNNIYTENLYDNDFKDIVNTTANWDTTSHAILFAVAQQAQSLSIDYNNGVITSARLTAIENGGAFPYQYYLTSDGGTHWESVTNGILHTFTNTGIDLRWRIINTAGEVDKITIDQYH